MKKLSKKELRKIIMTESLSLGGDLEDTKQNSDYAYPSEDPMNIIEKMATELSSKPYQQGGLALQEAATELVRRLEGIYTSSEVSEILAEAVLNLTLVRRLR